MVKIYFVIVNHVGKDKWFMSANGYVMCGVCGFRWHVNESMDHDWELYKGNESITIERI